MAAAAVFKFIGDATSLKAETLKAKASLKDVADEGEKSGSRMKKFGDMGKNAAMAVAAGLAIATAAAIKFGKESIDSFEKAAKETIKMSRVTGATAEEASRLRFMAQQTGTDVELLSKAIGQMSKRAENGNLEKLGFSARDAAGNMRPTLDVLKDVAARIESMPNGMEKNALAMQLFGKSGMDLVPFLNRGAAGLEELAQKSDEFGWTIGEKGVEDLKKQIAAQRDMTAAWEGAKIQLGEQLMPVMTKVAVWLAEHLPGIIDWVKEKVHDFSVGWGILSEKFTTFKDNFDRGVEIIKRGVDTFVTRFSSGYDKIKNFLDDSGIADVFIGVWNIIRSTVDAVLKQLLGLWQVFSGLFQGDWDKVWQGIKNVFAAAWDTMVLILRYAWDGIKEIVGGALGVVWNLVRGVFGAVVDFVSGIPGRVFGALRGLWNTVTDQLGAAWTGVQWVWAAMVNWVTGLPGGIARAASGLWDGIKDAFRGAMNWIVDHWNSFGFQFPTIDVPLVGKVGGWRFDTPDIPRFGMGAVVDRPTLALIAEAGSPEVVFPTDNPDRGFELLRRAGVDTGGGGDTPPVSVVNHIYGSDSKTVARDTTDEMLWRLKGRR